MHIIDNKEYEDCQPPEVLDSHNVIYYSSHYKALRGSIRDKAHKFIELGLVEYEPYSKCFFVNPIPDYNKTRYTIQKMKTGFECDCQGCQTKIKKGTYNPETDSSAACSHILAVYLWLKIKNWRKSNDTGY